MINLRGRRHTTKRPFPLFAGQMQTIACLRSRCEAWKHKKATSPVWKVMYTEGKTIFFMWCDKTATLYTKSSAGETHFWRISWFFHQKGQKNWDFILFQWSRCPALTGNTVCKANACDLNTYACVKYIKIKTGSSCLHCFYMMWDSKINLRTATSDTRGPLTFVFLACGAESMFGPEH